MKQPSLHSLLNRIAFCALAFVYGIGVVYPNMSIGGRMDQLVNTGYTYSHRLIVDGELQEVWTKDGKSCAYTWKYDLVACNQI